MSILSGIRSGLQSGIFSGINPRAGGLPTTIGGLAASATFSDDLVAIMGTVAPTAAYYGGDASGALELIAGTDNFTDAGTPGKQQTDHAFGAGTLTTEILTTTTDQLIAAANTVHDVAAVPVAILYVGQLSTTVGTLGLLGKRDAIAPNNGYELNHNGGGFLNWVVDSASGASSRIVSVDHGTAAPFSALMTRAITLNEANLHTNKGDATGGRFAETLTNAATFSIGKGRTSGHLHHSALLVIWIDEGEDFDDTHLAAFNTHFGIS